LFQSTKHINPLCALNEDVLYVTPGDT